MTKHLTLRRLAMAIAAAGLLAGGVVTALSAEISATAFVTNLDQYVQNGEMAAAKDALLQLKSFGITHIKIGEEYILIDDVLTALADPMQARLVLAHLMTSVNSGITAMFVAEDRVVASINWSPADQDIFPTGSAG